MTKIFFTSGGVVLVSETTEDIVELISSENNLDTICLTSAYGRPVFVRVAHIVSFEEADSYRLINKGTSSFSGNYKAKRTFNNSEY